MGNSSKKKEFQFRQKVMSGVHSGSKDEQEKQVARAQAPTKSERGEGQREQGGKGVLAGWLVEVWGMVGGGGREVINQRELRFMKKVLVLQVSSKSRSFLL